MNPGRTRDCRFVRQVMVPMRDGVRLAASIFLPATEGRYPVVLQRLPYNRLDWLDDGERWADAGYVYVCQDTRGRYDSEGTFDPFVQEIPDTPDTIDWIRQQPWCDGQVGQMGPSYLAWVQTLAVTRGDPPFADAIVPSFAPCTGWRRGWYANGPLSLALDFFWMCFDVGSRTKNDVVLGLFDLDELYRRLPLETLDISSGSGEVPLWREVMSHPTPDSYWEKFSILDRYDRFTMPSLHIAGWYDYYPAEMISDWNRIVSAENNGAEHRLVIGPWGHYHGLEPTADGKRALDFGPEAGLDNFHLYRSWFDRVFKGQVETSGVGDRPIRLFVMGRNTWRDEDEWPLARTEYTEYYLHSEGKANTLHGDGVLDRRPPLDEPADRYSYDPANPVPTRGGNHSIGPASEAHNRVIWCGPCDQCRSGRGSRGNRQRRASPLGGVERRRHRFRRSPRRCPSRWAADQHHRRSGACPLPLRRLGTPWADRNEHGAAVHHRPSVHQQRVPERASLAPRDHEQQLPALGSKPKQRGGPESKHDDGRGSSGDLARHGSPVARGLAGNPWIATNDVCPRC